MHAGAGGSVSPLSTWTNGGAELNITATPSNGYAFVNWSAGGAGSYTGTANPGTVTMNGPVIESANFATISKIISFSGSLAFGTVTVDGSSNQTMTISNSGNSGLTVSNIIYPVGFSGGWSGLIPAGESTNVTVRFSPVQPTNYAGNLTVTSDATGGSNTLAVSGTGVPLARPLLGITVRTDGTLSVAYTTTPGFPYHVETTTNLSPTSWAAIPGSATNAIGSTVTFVDPNPLGGGPRYYRAVSP